MTVGGFTAETTEDAYRFGGIILGEQRSLTPQILPPVGRPWRFQLERKNTQILTRTQDVLRAGSIRASPEPDTSNRQGPGTLEVPSSGTQCHGTLLIRAVTKRKKWRALRFMDHTLSKAEP